MFQDEGRFGLINTPRRCWAPQGVRPHVGSQLVREYTYGYAAISPCDGVLDSLILPDANSENMSIFLEEVGSRHAEENILMVVDSASWHHSNSLRVPDNIELLFQPPYSPELNPVEHLWEEIREKYFGNHVFANMDAVEEQLIKAFRALENDPDKVKSLAGFKWILNI